MDREERQLIEIVQSQDWLMDLLRATRELNLPDWYIAAGTIRNTVWNVRHGYPSELHQNDVDVVYFDPDDLKGASAEGYEQKLRAVFPNREWEVVNQAGAHLMECTRQRGRPAAASSSEAIAYWTETPTCVGVRLEQDDSFTLCAPHGLDDLFHLTVQPPPEPYRDLGLYLKRMEDKKWGSIWPRLQIWQPNSE